MNSFLKALNEDRSLQVLVIADIACDHASYEVETFIGGITVRDGEVTIDVNLDAPVAIDAECITAGALADTISGHGVDPELNDVVVEGRYTLFGYKKVAITGINCVDRNEKFMILEVEFEPEI